jgi:hypothetical protein
MKLDSQFPPGTIRRVSISPVMVKLYPYEGNVITYTATNQTDVKPAENIANDNTAK